jgi:hypothetical protein
MKDRLGWPMATLAILTFSFGQATAAASQVVTSTSVASAVTSTTAAAALAPTAAGVLNAPTSATDKTKVPHYFGPYPNWAN